MGDLHDLGLASVQLVGQLRIAGVDEDVDARRRRPGQRLGRRYYENALLARQRAAASGVSFRVVQVAGDHMQALAPALADFLELARAGP